MTRDYAELSTRVQVTQYKQPNIALSVPEQANKSLHGHYPKGLKVQNFCLIDCALLMGHCRHLLRRKDLRFHSFDSRVSILFSYFDALLFLAEAMYHDICSYAKSQTDCVQKICTQMIRKKLADSGSCTGSRLVCDSWNQRVKYKTDEAPLVAEHPRFHFAWFKFSSTNCMLYRT